MAARLPSTEAVFDELLEPLCDCEQVDEAKQELADIVEYLRDADKFRALGAKLPKGMLKILRN